MQDEIERLVRDNNSLQQQLDLLLGQVDAFQGDNSAMKSLLLET